MRVVCLESENALTFNKDIQSRQKIVENLYKLYPLLPWSKERVQQIWDEAQQSPSLLSLLRMYREQMDPDELHRSPYQEEIAFIGQIIKQEADWPLPL